MDSDSIGSTSSRSGSSLNESYDNSCPTSDSKGSESDDEIVTEPRKYVAEVVKRPWLESTSQDEFSPQGTDWNDLNLLNSQLKVALDAGKFTADKLTKEVEIKNRELKAYQQMLDIACETIYTERENALRRGSRLAKENVTLARRVSGLFMSTPQRRSLQSENLHKIAEVPRMSSPDAITVLDNEKKKFEAQTRIWHSMIQIEASRNVETKRLLDVKCEDYYLLSKKYHEASAELETCKRELDESKLRTCSLCSDLNEQIKRITSSFEESLKFERSRVEELKSALRFEREIVHDLAMAIGEREFNTIRRRAEQNHANQIKNQA